MLSRISQVRVRLGVRVRVRVGVRVGVRVSVRVRVRVRVRVNPSRISQDAIWHGAAQTTAGYVHGVTQVCHSSSGGVGPCLKRIITVFKLPEGHPLARLSAVERLWRIGIAIRVRIRDRVRVRIS